MEDTELWVQRMEVKSTQVPKEENGYIGKYTIERTDFPDGEPEYDNKNS